MTCTLVRMLLAISAICGLIAREATAVIYTIDPAQSSLSFAMFSDGIPLSEPQFPGSDVTSLSGTIDAAVVGSTITFTNTNNIQFANQSSPVAPWPGGGVPSPGTTSILPDNPGTNAANYGIIFIVPNDLSDPLNLNTAWLAGYGNIQNEIATLNGSASIAGGLFNAATLNVGVVSALLDWNLNLGNSDGPPQTGYSFLVGGNKVDTHFGVNTGAGNGSLIGNVLTVPMNVGVLVDVSGIFVDVVFTGQIVAQIASEAATVGVGANQSVTVGGGASTTGGVEGTLPGVSSAGNFVSNYQSQTSQAALQTVLGAAATGAINFGLAGMDASGAVLPNSAVQFWDLHFSGTFTGEATLTVHYDPALIGGADPSSLRLWHFTAGQWEPVENQVIDPLANTITFTTDSFSPFILGVPEPSSVALASLGGLAFAFAVSRRRRAESQQLDRPRAA